MIESDQDLEAALNEIALSNVPTLITLEEQHSDSLDFHDIHVSSLRDMLHAAFRLGFKHRDPGGF